jgi:hypothetical protein
MDRRRISGASRGDRRRLRRERVAPSPAHLAFSRHCSSFLIILGRRESSFLIIFRPRGSSFLIIPHHFQARRVLRSARRFRPPFRAGDAIPALGHIGPSRSTIEIHNSKQRERRAQPRATARNRAPLEPDFGPCAIFEQNRNIVKSDFVRRPEQTRRWDRAAPAALFV